MAARSHHHLPTSMPPQSMNMQTLYHLSHSSLVYKGYMEFDNLTTTHNHTYLKFLLSHGGRESMVVETWN